jgi:hypothetical protein
MVAVQAESNELLILNEERFDLHGDWLFCEMLHAVNEPAHNQFDKLIL